MKKLITILLVLCTVISTLLCGCDGNDKTVSETESGKPEAEFMDYVDVTKDIPVTKSTDKYRNYYEIFLYSYYDSNGDGIGDIQGLISKLDYLNDGDPETDTDLGIDGIWLMPIMPSPSYHKYDVTDYYGIDPQYGTIDDFKQLIAECNKRGINIIIDLVINHCSSQHPLFVQAKEEVKNGNLDGAAKYFNIKQFDVKPDGWSNITGKWYYECNFTPQMPEFDLSGKAARDEISKIVKYWLDMGVGGFRLDAVTYYTNDDTDGVEFLSWLTQTVENINPNAYIVGEYWVNVPSSISEMYESGVDSLFNFPFSGLDGNMIDSVNTNAGASFAASALEMQEILMRGNSDMIDATFLSNHDQQRSSGPLGKDTVKMKMAAAAYMLLPGNPFIYYGEEIGMGGNCDTDPDKRTGMVWSLTDLEGYTQLPPGAKNTYKPEQGVDEQLKDENSLLSYYKRIIKIKNQNPEIARGRITETIDTGKKSVGAYKIKYNDTQLIVVHNMSDHARTVTISKSEHGYTGLCADLVAGEAAEGEQPYITLDGETLYLPPYSTAILK